MHMGRRTIGEVLEQILKNQLVILERGNAGSIDWMAMVERTEECTKETRIMLEDPGTFSILL